MAIESILLQPPRLKSVLAVFKTAKLNYAIALCARMHKRDMTALRPIPLVRRIMLVAVTKRSKLELIAEHGSDRNLSQ